VACRVIESQGYNVTTGQYTKQLHTDYKFTATPAAGEQVVPPSLVTSAAITVVASYGSTNGQPRLQLSASVKDKVSGFGAHADSLVLPNSTTKDTILTVIFNYPNMDAVAVMCEPATLN
jgi:hypothetical protein